MKQTADSCQTSYVIIISWEWNAKWIVVTGPKHIGFSGTRTKEWEYGQGKWDIVTAGAASVEKQDDAKKRLIGDR